MFWSICLYVSTMYLRIGFGVVSCVFVVEFMRKEVNVLVLWMSLVVSLVNFQNSLGSFLMDRVWKAVHHLELRCRVISLDVLSIILSVCFS